MAAVAQKTAAELMQEAEELQKELVPDLYEGDEGTSDEGTSDKKDKAAPGDKAPEDKESEDKATDKGEGDKKDAEPPVQPSDDDLQAELAKVQHSSEVANGRLRVAAEENRALKEENESLKQRIASLESGDGGKADKTKEELLSRLTDKYGEDFVDDMDAYLAWKGNKDSGKAADHQGKHAASAPAVAVTPPEDVIYINAITNAIPDWKDIVGDQRFAEFLSEPDPFSGETRHNLIRKAHEQKDAARVAAFYNAFKKSSAEASKDNASAKKDKTSRLAPSSSSRVQGEGTITESFTPEQIKQMKDKIFEHKSKGRFKEAEGLQVKLDAYLNSLGG